MKIGIKFCGGCNPRYDRGKYFEEIKIRFSRYAFQLANDKENLSLLVAICGCSSKCVDVSNITTEKMIYIDHDDAFNALMRLLN